MKLVAAAIGQWTKTEIAEIEKAGALDVSLEGETANLLLEDVEISSEDIPGWSVASEGKVTVALDISITDELRAEGIARDFVNRIQNLRKDMGLEVQDKINIEVAKNEALINEALTANSAYICDETQALNLEIVDSLSDAQSIEIDDWTIEVKITVG